MQSIEGMIYSSSGMEKILEMSKKLAKTLVPILIIGEAGTGRKSLARVIHELGPNKECCPPIQEIPSPFLKAPSIGPDFG